VAKSKGLQYCQGIGDVQQIELVLDVLRGYNILWRLILKMALCDKGLHAYLLNSEMKVMLRTKYQQLQIY